MDNKSNAGPDKVYIVQTSPVLSNGVGMSGVMSQPTSRRVQLRANSKMELMKQQVEQEKFRRRAKPLTTNVPFTRQSESTHLAECPVKSELDASSAGDNDNNVPVVGGTVPVSYVLVSGLHQNTAVAHSAPNELLNSRKNMTSPLSLGDRASTATSISEMDELMSCNLDLELVDTVADKDLDVLTSLIQDDMLLNGSYAEGLVHHKSKPAIKSSASCPTMLSRQPSSGYRGGRQKEPPPPMMTETERLIWEKERVKKDNHNIIEKRRRYKINDCISELATLLPPSYDLDLQNKKGNILQASVDYIKRLKKQQLAVSKLVARQEELEKTNHQLALDVQRLQLMLQTPAVPGELLTQFADTDSHQQLLHDVTTQHVLQPLDSLYDGHGSELMTQTVMASDSSLADSEMASAGTDMGLPDFGFPSLDVNMADDGMAIPDLLSISSLSSDIAHLMY